MKQKSQQNRKKDTGAASQEAGFSEAISLVPSQPPWPVPSPSLVLPGPGK